MASKDWEPRKGCLCCSKPSLIVCCTTYILNNIHFTNQIKIIHVIGLWSNLVAIRRTQITEWYRLHSICGQSNSPLNTINVSTIFWLVSAETKINHQRRRITTNFDTVAGFQQLDKKFVSTSLQHMEIPPNVDVTADISVTHKKACH